MKGQEIRGFQSEMKQLLHLMIHSLYSNKEIFLRELISNASDAADKLRFFALSQPDLYENDNELHVRLYCNKEKRTITLSDNGIGMLREEVIENLGTIAKSGTKDFLKSVGSSDPLKGNQLIGQFGVGFYSAFIVADKVTVYTRAAGVSSDKGVYWESDGTGYYTIADIDKPSRGTDIILHLREGEDIFLDSWQLKNIIRKYSDHIALPVEIEVSVKTTAECGNDNEDVTTWEKINKGQALWTRNKVDISDDEYKEFYKHLSHDGIDPLIWSHNLVEGKQEYISLLYIPIKAQLDMWNRDNKHGLKLYVQRVFIMDDAEQFMPNYLRFVKGIIDSKDLPLNVSREILQDSRITQNMKVALTKRVLSILSTLAKDNNEQYQIFWQQFGLVLKEGIAEDSANRENIAKLLRFTSTHSNDIAQIVSLDNYVSRMIKGQNNIYYITADSYAAAKNSPHLELLCKKGIEVLLLSDRIDEWMMNYLTEYCGKSFQSVSKADLLLDKLVDDEETKEQKEAKKALIPFIQRVKKYLGERIKEVRITSRLIDTPAIVTTDANEMTTQMVKLLVAAGQVTPAIKYIFELNPNHVIVKRIADIHDDEVFNEWIELLLDQAMLAERSTLDDPNKFIRRVNKLLSSL